MYIITLKLETLCLAVMKSLRNFSFSRCGHFETYTSSRPSPLFIFETFCLSRPYCVRTLFIFLCTSAAMSKKLNNHEYVIALINYMYYIHLLIDLLMQTAIARTDNQRGRKRAAFTFPLLPEMITSCLQQCFFILSSQDRWKYLIVAPATF